MKNAGLITSLLIEQDNVLRSLRDSLQKEFEYFITLPNFNEKALLAKKRQIETINNELKQSEVIFKNVLEFDVKNEKFYLIILKLGLNVNIINKYIRLDINYLRHIVKENLEIETFLIDLKKELKPEIKTSEKPILDFEKLQQMAKDTGKTINYK
jgi:hypothetical protein